MIGARIDVVFCDVDGTLTVGQLGYAPDGSVWKFFGTRDGHGVAMLRAAGIPFVFVTGRADPAMRARAADLGAEVRTMQHPASKRPIVEAWLAEHAVDRAHAVFLGDDLPDLEGFAAVDWSIAPNDAHPQVRRAARRVTRARGGLGAVREAADWILARR
jgi:YrbI family 3-deoxy-D-manno-octulosonate 8-phosphate phosphatase